MVENDYNETQIFENAYFYPLIKDFQGTSEINPNISISGSKPINYFEYFFYSLLIERILDETNCYYESQNREDRKSHQTTGSSHTKDEFERFLGLSILMGHIRKSDLKDYWSKDPLFYTPIFGQIMSRDRFLAILRYLHFHDNEDTSEIAHHALVKIKPIIDYLQTKFSAALIPGKNLCIDESLIL